jgi:uncharacterized protein with NRDE domain
VCLIVFAQHAHPAYRLLVAANRDEFFDRPTARAAFWPDAPEVLGGRDLDKGGTWLAVASRSRWTAVTNFREGVRPDPAAPSRGQLTRDFLLSEDSPGSYAMRVCAAGERFAGFNLLIGDAEAAYYVTNRSAVAQAIEPGVHGLSNHLLDSAWPKVQRSRDRVSHLLERMPGVRSKSATAEDMLLGGLFEMLADRTQWPDHELPSTGVSLEWERVLSANFVATEKGYGTRTSTVALLRSDGSLYFEERTFGPAGQEAGRQKFETAVTREGQERRTRD